MVERSDVEALDTLIAYEGSSTCSETACMVARSNALPAKGRLSARAINVFSPPGKDRTPIDKGICGQLFREVA